MANWNNFYLQKMGKDEHNNDWPVYESVTQWGVFCSEIPFVLFNKVKEPSKNSFPDEDGDDEFIPSTGLRYESYTMEVKFGCKLLSGGEATKFGNTVNDVRTSVLSFLNYLRSSGMLKMYSTNTGIGRQYVRLSSVNNSAKWKNENGEQWLIFSVTFKVNDPVTDIVLSTGSSQSGQESQQGSGQSQSSGDLESGIE